MITKEIIEHIEGEASIHFDIQNDKVKSTAIAFTHFRAMEQMLQGKDALDALVITPRVCGICGHAHLMASVRAIEDAYANAEKEIKLSQKGKDLREFTLIMETIQNHFKWLYLTLIPQLQKLDAYAHVATPLKGAFAAKIATKAIATFAGQWPHSSYMIPGGITSDPTHIDILKAKSIVEELIEFFEKESLGISVEEFLAFESCKDFNKLDGDIANIEKSLISLQMHKKGLAFDRFLVAGEHSHTQAQKLVHTKSYSLNLKYISIEDSFNPNEKSYAKNALYNGKYYETGPLSRLMAQKNPFIKNVHRRYKDSAYSRIMARIFEMALLLQHSLELLQNIKIEEESCVASVNISTITAQGTGVVEAPRGPLIHTVEIKEGKIQNYQIITPTQWNIGSATQENPMPAQQAMLGLTKEEALFVFRSFDVCSVCTTH